METASFKFLGYIVTEANFEIKDAFFQTPSSKNELSIEVQQNFVKENPRFVEVLLKIKTNTENQGLRLSLVIKGGFEGNKDMPEDLFKQLYTISAPSVLFPYARAIVSTYTAQAGIPQIILPLFNFTTGKQEEIKKKE